MSSDDVEDFDMEIVEEDELGELGADGASSSEKRSRVESDGLGNETAGGSDFDAKCVSSKELSSGATDSRQEGSDQRETNPTSIKDIDVEGWKAARADDLMHITRGASPRPKGDPELFGGDIPWVKISDVDVKSERYATETSDTVTEKGAKKSKYIAEDTLIVSNSGTCGYPVFLGMDACVHDGWLILKEFEEELNADYLYEYITWKQNYLKSLAPGSTQINLNTSRFGSLDIQVPPLPEQRKIASVLYTVDQAIQKTEAVIEQAQRVKRGLMQELFRNSHNRVDEDPLVGRYPAGWSLHDLGDVTEIVDAEHFTPDYTDEGFPVIRPGDLEQGYISLDDISKRVDKDTYEELIRRHKPSADDIVYSRSQNFAVASQVLENKPYCIGQDMVVIQSRGIETNFLLHLLNSPLVRNQAARMATGSTFQRVNLGDIKSFKVPIPDVETQRKIGSTIDEFERKSLNEEKTLRVMKQLKKGIMQDLLTGEVRTADKAIEVLEEVKTHG